MNYLRTGERNLPVLLLMILQVFRKRLSKKIYQLNKLRCNLHFLLGLADASENGLKSFEKAVRSEPISSFNRIISFSESGILRTIRTVCKTFQKHGSEQSGVMSPFAIFLRENPVRLTKFKGNRFNVVFWNAACVYFHHNHFMEFFRVHGTPNKLLRAVKEDLQETINMAGIRALGIMDKLITGPFWRLCESVENILDLNKVIVELQNNMVLWTNDASELLFQQTPGFSSAVVHNDNLYLKLFEKRTTEFDELTIAALEIILGHCCITTQRQMKDVLEGGVLSNVTENLREETASAPTTNALSERVFASYDRLLRQRPNATTLI